MFVGELIEMLSSMPKETTVCFRTIDDDYYFGPPPFLEDKEVDIYNDETHEMESGIVKHVVLCSDEQVDNDF